MVRTVSEQESAATGTEFSLIEQYPCQPRCCKKKWRYCLTCCVSPLELSMTRTSSSRRSRGLCRWTHANADSKHEYLHLNKNKENKQTRGIKNRSYQKMAERDQCSTLQGNLLSSTLLRTRRLLRRTFRLRRLLRNRKRLGLSPASPRYLLTDPDLSLNQPESAGEQRGRPPPPLTTPLKHPFSLHTELHLSTPARYEVCGGMLETRST